MTGQAPAPILFLSGAGLPEWIWDDLRAELPGESVVGAYPKPAGRGRAAPAPAETPGDASSEPPAEITLRDIAVAVGEQAPWPRFTVVAHSIGGVVGAELAAIAPARIDAFLGVAAAIPPPGRSFVQAMPQPQRTLLGALMRLVGTRPPDRAIRALAAGASDADANRIVADFEPESERLYRDPRGIAAFPGRTGYVITTNDREFPAALQRRFGVQLGEGHSLWTRSLPTGHLPMLERPAALAALISEFTGPDDP